MGYDGETPSERDRRLARLAFQVMLLMPDEESEFMAVARISWALARDVLRMPMPDDPFGKPADQAGPEPGGKVRRLRRDLVIVAVGAALALAFKFGDAGRDALIQAAL